MHARQDDIRERADPAFWDGGGSPCQRRVALPAIGDHDRAGLDVGADDPVSEGPDASGTTYPTRGTAPDFDGPDDHRPVAQLASPT